MAFKEIQLDDTLTATIYKRRSSSSIRLTVTSAGKVRVTIPAWAPYKSGEVFARGKLPWIKLQIKPPKFVSPGQQIGKQHTVSFVPARTKIAKSRIQTDQITIYHPITRPWNDPEVQTVAEAASIRALKKQAESLLPKRLREIANQFEYEYASVKIKRLKSRWGSCDSHKNIVFNLFLIQLPWECIDYVILHELVHTHHLHHGTDFWAEMEQFMPRAKQIRKQMRRYQPELHGLPG